MPSTHAADNRVLARLADESLEQLVAISAQRHLNLGDVVHRFGAPTQDLLFPLSGMISLTVPTPEGDNVEVALVGREGVFGINTLLGDAPDLEAIAQVEGDSLSTPFQAIDTELRAAVRGAVDQYAASLLVEQTAACNRVHSVEERTARWLLHAADRARTTDLNLTHEFMAMMLGVGEPALPSS